MKCLRILVFGLILASSSLFAQGKIILPAPTEHSRFAGQVDLKEVKAHVKLKKGAGEITLRQTFLNNTSYRLEGEYLFSIPDEAEIHDFHLYIDGKKTKGEILDRDDALRIYEDIVKSMQDPALLEYSNLGLFKARIYPIEPNSSRDIELSYSQILPHKSGTYKFTLPIRQTGQGSIEKYHMQLELDTEAELANIYSPSHNIEVRRSTGNRAIISFEENYIDGGKDFILYYSLADKEINATILNFRPRTDRDGYFMSVISPVNKATEKENIAKDVIFVIDVSGSMNGEKIVQAREALKFCVNSLKPDDRFDIIRFSSSIENFQGGLKKAGADEKKNAGYFIDNLTASGGTNINGALQQALQLKPRNDDRPTNIVFVTDGLPTEGETDGINILKNLRNSGKDFIRVFSFGVGYDVNTFLLDKLSIDTHGSCNYIKAGESIENEVSAFFSKISSPVLTNLELDFGELDVYDIYPQKLPDVFMGQSISVFGRYQRPGSGKMVLTGKQSDKILRFDYSLEFDNRIEDNEFISKLWANRKVSHLMNQIRFNGENPELVESIKNLARKYGIVTPYTSYLVREQEIEFSRAQADVLSGEAGASMVKLHSEQVARQKRSQLDEESMGSGVYYDAMVSKPKAASASTGKSAVMSSRLMKKLANSDFENKMLLTIHRIAGKTYYLKDGFWIEDGLSRRLEADRTIQFLSGDYFNFLESNKELSKILSLGEKLIFEFNGEIIEIN